ncbi:hypothetical protein [Flavobacterium sp.]|uniref:hypothetical protein n=1 Tax=Flavobacterium sp. TaxID=239 RepID=UPI003D0D4BDF
MNVPHYHLLVNHFPIIGLFFGCAILLYGLLKKQEVAIKIAYVIFIFCMLMGKISMMTGDRAEHFLENNDRFSHELIEAHEESAELFMKGMYILGVSSIIGLYMQSKHHPKSKFLAFTILVLVLVTLFLSQNVGVTGGIIAHDEIRNSLLK